MSLTIFAFFVLVVGVALVTISQVAGFYGLIKLVAVPMLVLATSAVICGRLSHLTRQEWFGYIRAELLLVGLLASVPFAFSAALNILQGVMLNQLADQLVICGVGCTMLGVCGVLRKWNKSCIPQLMSLSAF
jgi:hypothetical protein